MSHYTVYTVEYRIPVYAVCTIYTGLIATAFAQRHSGFSCISIDQASDWPYRFMSRHGTVIDSMFLVLQTKCHWWTGFILMGIVYT